MNKKQIGVTLLALCIMLSFALVSSAATNIVSPGQSINSAISSAQSGDIVFLTSGTYQLGNEKIIMKSGIHLKGESAANTILKAGPNTAGSISGSTSDGWIYCSGLSNIEISNLAFASSASGTSDGGRGETRNCILLKSCSDVKIHDNKVIKYVYNDFVKCHSGTNIQVYDNSGQCGHDFIEFLRGTKNSRAYGNDIVVQTNTGIRCDGATNIELDHNTLTGAGGTGWCLFEMENSLSGINIHHNIMHDYRGSSGSYAVVPVHASGYVSVHDNVLWNVGSIAFGTSKDNIINPADKNIASWVAKGYGAGSSGSVEPPVIIPVEPPVVPPVVTPASVVSVVFKGPGQFVCAANGKTASNDQIVINKALAFAKSNNISEVRLTGPHSYYINSAIITDGIKISGVKGVQVIWNF